MDAHKFVSSIGCTLAKQRNMLNRRGLRVFMRAIERHTSDDRDGGDFEQIGLPLISIEFSRGGLVDSD